VIKSQKEKEILCHPDGGMLLDFLVSVAQNVWKIGIKRKIEMENLRYLFMENLEGELRDTDPHEKSIEKSTTTKNLNEVFKKVMIKKSSPSRSECQAL